MAAVFPGTPAQEELALRSRERVAATLSVQVETPVIRGARFHRAEDYHQKYYLRHDATLMRELAAYDARQLTDSTVAARLNGYVAGRGFLAGLQGEVASFGLSATARAHLEQVVRAKQRRG